MHKAWSHTLALVLVLIAALGCEAEKTPGDGLRGPVMLDGSSTVYPISEAVAEEFGKGHPQVRVTVGISGTGGGFKKFCLGETDINDASRPITPPEAEVARQHGVEYLELPVAYDGLSVVVNRKSGFVDHFTVAELTKIWQPGSTVKRWSDIRPGWPERELHLYGPGADSGTFDYFTEVINGKSQRCRADYSASEDDNVLARGVAGDADALGFFGYAYYVENQDRLKAVPIDQGKGQGPVAPSVQAINDGRYAPLSRPIFIYVSRKGIAKPQVRAFVDYYLEQAPHLAQEVGYVPMPQAAYEAIRKQLADWIAPAAGTTGN